MPDPFPHPSADNGPLAVRARMRGWWHRLSLGGITAIPLASVAIGWLAGSPVDQVVVRLWVLLALVFTVVVLVATGFDRRYPTPTFGAVALRAVALAAAVGAVLFLIADAFVYGGVDGGDQRSLQVGGVVVVSLAAAGWYGLWSRPQSSFVAPGAASTANAPGWDEPPRSTIATFAAVAIVSVPVVLGQLVIALFSGLCGAGATSLVWFGAAIVTPLILALAERVMGKRWSGKGLAIVVGRLVLVAMAILTILVLASYAIPGSVDCESTIGGQLPLAQAAQ